MADDGNVFSADIPELLDGAPKIEHFSTIMNDIYTNLSQTLDRNPLDESGGDDISKSLKANYEPPKDACLEFLRNVKELAKNHSDDLGNMGNLFNDMNTDNTNQAVGVPGHRH
ncbi:hypothetical protein [Actinomadura sp. DC4]|uniref:hypothetical protein n=1 Tax=Actinomadura sp. DC4 TaxID=3055069 RepID=UPI0025B155F2|nr:hypothetical protein [Actinomadura sp. DC4]MDN3359678.1 hypothetical protein [Actinomadura sp. DC4]